MREIENQRASRAPALRDEHAAIVAALTARDGAKGSRILRRHLTMTMKDAVAVIKEALARSYLAYSA